MVLMSLFFHQSLSASINGKKGDAAPWIEILTSRDLDHLNKGCHILYMHSSYLCLHACFCVLVLKVLNMNMLLPLTLYIIDSVDGTGATEWTDGGSGCGETIHRRLSIGSENFR